MAYTSIDRFRNPVTGYTDWEKYRRAQQENGERCFECGAYIFRTTGHAQSCNECRAMTGIHEVEHHSKIRCPGCGYKWDVFDLFQEGDHSVRCDNCDCEFTVTTKISYYFVSPERIKDSLDEETADGL